ncbi:putative F0F1-ATPase subunit [Candidatus Accumulibacter aalborgensis]|uniref:Putative F0F1-ATPase subunit n=1 Tax=Candidatus Accumulibacter aalborgensis TaxID=1860102 RepID=A0A1A8XKM0_9PROT|nr:AtpZ/AtpI family protein [Candidatus Accumulibacter aalborgensis]SBT05729.1 putative F0F1-ATPase subunit [Candidatus Accumulibacter aalborgensis]
MNDQPADKAAKGESTFAAQIGAKAARKLRAQRNDSAGLWAGLGMMGLIGWSVVVPTLLGAALGLWLDKQHPGPHSWTLALLLGGLAIGCLNAWHWVAEADKAMHAEQEENDE